MALTLSLYCTQFTCHSPKSKEILGYLNFNINNTGSHTSRHRPLYFTKIVILDNVKGGNAGWLADSFHMNQMASKIQAFAILDDLSQMVISPTQILDYVTDMPNTLNLNLSYKPHININKTIK